MKKITFFFKFFGCRNWYQGIDKPSFYQWIYEWRIGYDTAMKLTKINFDD